jgi:sugar phosphate isomerase/epimerase
VTAKIFLAIDNCFATKRWCEPAEWMRVIKDLGIRYVEASADNEIDPLYSCPAFINDWVKEVRRESEKSGVRVVNLYSGHGTYSTLGLGHYDARVREHFVRDWVRPMLRTAGRLGAGIGFFAHAFSEKMLREPALYRKAWDTLIEIFRRLSIDAESSGVTTFGVEQMYTPHQIPWTIANTAEFFRQTNDKSSGLPVYITIDTGHQSGQDRFLPPSTKDIRDFVRTIRKSWPSNIYVGPAEFFATFRDMVLGGASSGAVQKAVAKHVRAFPHLFSAPGDGDTYRWLEHYAAFSPIIHLQQTNGKESSHKNFTKKMNEWGVIRAEKVLRAIKTNYMRPVPKGFPPKCREIYLMLEPFLGTAAHPRVMLEEIAESAAYWRKFIPQDGLDIDTLCSRLSK